MRTKLFEIINENKAKIIGIAVAVITVIVSAIFLWGSDLFYFILAISFVIGGLPFFVSLILEERATRMKDEMFLEFSRGLVESVKAGTPLSKSVLNIKDKDYGILNPYIDKLANQISLGIPVNTAFETFARDLNSKTISRAIGIIGESEKVGGKIGDILESVVKSITQIEKLKKERKATMYNLVVQGYIIFMIFLVIMLIMQFKVLPIASQIGKVSSESGGSIAGVSTFSMGQAASPEELTRPFTYLLIVQGFFAGLVIGKLSEGRIKAGFKHSFILIIVAALISTGAKVFFG